LANRYVPYSEPRSMSPICRDRRRTLLPMAVDGTEPFKAIDLADGFHDEDMAALDRLDPAGRAGQLQLRHQLWRYADAMWDHIKARHRGNGGDLPLLADDPAYSAVAGIRDLAAELQAHAAEACARAGENPAPG